MIPFLVIEVAKLDSRHWIKTYPEIKIIRAEEHFRFNALKPPEGVHPKVGLADFIEGFTYHTDVMMRSKSLLVDKVDELYELYGIYKGNDEYPDLEDIEDWLFESLKKTGLRGDDFILRNYQRFHMFNTLTDIFKCSVGSDLEMLLNEAAVIELVGLPDVVINTLIVQLLTWILRYRLVKGHRGRLRHVTIIDEGKRIFPITSERNYMMGIPPIDFLISYAREFGEGIVVADQEMSKLSTNLRANTNTKIAHFTSGVDLEETKKTFNLDQDQMKKFTTLPTGVGLLKMDEGYQKPFLVKFDHLPIVRDVMDEEIDYHSREFIKQLNRTVRPRSKVLIEMLKKDKEKKILLKEEEVYLIHINDNPFLTEDERKKALGWTNYMANRVLKNLVLKGFVVKKRFYTGRPGNQPMLQEPTLRAKEYLKSIGMRVSKGKGKGGIVHQNWARIISEFWKTKGMEIFIEPNENGANTDVLIIDSQGIRTAIEIALSVDNQVNNILRDLKHFDRVIMATETRILLERIKTEAQKSINGSNLNRVKFCLLQEFLN